MNKENLKSFFAVWIIILIINQVFIFGGCFAPHCLIAALPHTGIIAFLITYYFIKEDKEDIQEVYTKPKSTTNQKEDKKTQQDPLKEKGDMYEKFVGKKFEKKGELVIYNGFINGYADKGVDVISISSREKSINLIQCKNWTKKPMLFEDIKTICKKLDEYNIKDIPKDSHQIYQHLQIKKDELEISSILDKKIDDYVVRKTLYIASDKVMDSNIKKHLKMIKPNIFRYRDMKIVILSL